MEHTDNLLKISENFPNLEKKNSIQTQKAYRTPDMTRDETPHNRSQSECQIQYREITTKAQENINSHTKADT